MKLIRITQDPARNAVVQVDEETAEAAAADGWGNVLDGSYPFVDIAPQELLDPESRPASFSRFLEKGTAAKKSPTKPAQSQGKTPTKPTTPAETERPAETPRAPETPARPSASSEAGNKPDKDK